MFMTAKTLQTEQFNAIYYATHKKLHSIILNICRDNDLTADILQKVYLKLWEEWDNVKDKANLFPLLFTYSKNIYIDDLRKVGCGRAAVANITRTIDTYSPSAESQYKRKEYLEAINSVLSRLTTRRRQVIQLYLEEGLSRKKLAEKLCVSPNTVDNHLQKSLSILRSELQVYLKTGID